MIPERQSQPYEPAFFECECCEVLFREDKLTYVPSVDQMLCPHCVEEVELKTIN